jgi:cobyrinic acid a,c-diamide synthase
LVSLIERFIDIDGILKIQKSEVRSQKSEVEKTNIKLRTPNSEFRNSRIAVALDDAFCFYYQENLDILEKLGVEIVFFSPLKDKKLPDDINGIYLGGGYPELYAKKLESNRTLRRDIKDFADKGLPIYAECGGLMYLGKGLKNLNGKGYKMVGIFSWVSRMLKKIKSLGYREVKTTDGSPFLKKGHRIRGHEFHYSEIDEPPRRIKRVYIINPKSKIRNPKSNEGFLYKNTLASYIHLHFASNPKFAKGFIEKCREV